MSVLVKYETIIAADASPLCYFVADWDCTCRSRSEQVGI